MTIGLQPHPEWGSAAWAVLRTSPVESSWDKLGRYGLSITSAPPNL